MYKFQYPSNSVNPPHLKIALSNPQSVSSSTVWSIFHAVLMLWWQLPTHPDQTRFQVTKSRQCLKKLKLFRGIIIALIVCHKEQVYHGDLKGTNILLDKCLVRKKWVSAVRTGLKPKLSIGEASRMFALMNKVCQNSRPKPI